MVTGLASQSSRSSQSPRLPLCRHLRPACKQRRLAWPCCAGWRWSGVGRHPRLWASSRRCWRNTGRGGPARRAATGARGSGGWVVGGAGAGGGGVGGRGAHNFGSPPATTSHAGRLSTCWRPVSARMLFDPPCPPRTCHSQLSSPSLLHCATQDIPQQLPGGGCPGGLGAGDCGAMLGGRAHHRRQASTKFSLCSKAARLRSTIFWLLLHVAFHDTACVGLPTPARRQFCT